MNGGRKTKDEFRSLIDVDVENQLEPLVHFVDFEKTAFVESSISEATASAAFILVYVLGALELF